jgi:hypothetical protein
LELYACIARGFDPQRRLRACHRRFLFRALLPLHRPNGKLNETTPVLAIYHEQLTFAITLLLQRARTDVDTDYGAVGGTAATTNQSAAGSSQPLSGSGSAGFGGGSGGGGGGSGDVDDVEDDGAHAQSAVCVAATMTERVFDALFSAWPDARAGNSQKEVLLLHELQTMCDATTTTTTMATTTTTTATNSTTGDVVEDATSPHMLCALCVAGGASAPFSVGRKNGAFGGIGIGLGGGDANSRCTCAWPRSVFERLLTLLAACVRSMNQRTAQRALQFFADARFISGALQQERQQEPQPPSPSSSSSSSSSSSLSSSSSSCQLLRRIFAFDVLLPAALGKRHWNATVNKMRQSLLRLLQSTDAALFASVARRYWTAHFKAVNVNAAATSTSLHFGGCGVLAQTNDVYGDISTRLHSLRDKHTDSAVYAMLSSAYARAPVSDTTPVAAAAAAAAVIAAADDEFILALTDARIDELYVDKVARRRARRERRRATAAAAANATAATTASATAAADSADGMEVLKEDGDEDERNGADSSEDDDDSDDDADDVCTVPAPLPDLVYTQLVFGHSLGELSCE